MRALGLDGEPWLSDHPGGVVDLARRAADEGVALVVVVGGDGTVHEAVNGLMLAGDEGRPELAVIAQGTGDDFARGVGIPSSFDAAVAVVREGWSRTIDVGRAEYRTTGGSPATAYFASMAGTGMSGAVAGRLNTTTKALGGKASSLIATVAVFRRWKNVEMTIELDGDRSSALTEDVLVGNTEYHNGGMRLCPGARPDDGLLDVLVIGDISKKDLALVLPRLYRGTHLPHPKARLVRAKRISIDASRPLPIELDGEQPGTTPVTFDVVPAALRVRVPGTGSPGDGQGSGPGSA